VPRIYRRPPPTTPTALHVWHPLRTKSRHDHTRRATCRPCRRQFPEPCATPRASRAMSARRFSRRAVRSADSAEARLASKRSQAGMTFDRQRVTSLSFDTPRKNYLCGCLNPPGPASPASRCQSVRRTSASPQSRSNHHQGTRCSNLTNHKQHP